MKINRALVSLAAALAGVWSTGCAHLGPKTVVADRFDYSSAIAESWKQQTLLNIVKLRYADLPVFVEVASVVSGYSMETSVNLGGSLSSPGTVQGDGIALGGAGRFTDRPTITYMPMTGERFLRGLITPIDPKNIFFLIQSGYPADFLLALAVESLNGVRNRSTSSGPVREADPEFLRALELLRDVQGAGAVGMRVETDEARSTLSVLFFRRDDVPPEIVEKMAELRRLLELPSDQQRFVLIYSPVRGTEQQLAVNSRSMLQIMSAFSTYIDVPEAHRKGQSGVTSADGASGVNRPGRVRIHSGREKPARSFSAVRYRDHWFWIEDDDWLTKRSLTAVMFFFTLVDNGGNDKVPMITIPAQ